MATPAPVTPEPAPEPEPKPIETADSDTTLYGTTLIANTYIEQKTIGFLHVFFKTVCMLFS